MIMQIALLFLVGVILIGAVSAVALYGFSTRYVREQLESLGNSTAEDLRGFIFRYPAHEWLLRYWYEHYDELEIEYDAIYTGGTETEAKFALLTGRHPELQPEYATTEIVEALPPEDQKLFAEIIYSWLIDRVDYIQSSFGLDYLFCVVTEEPYEQQFVLFIAAKKGEVRGTEPGQLYPIGRSINVTQEIQAAMREAVSGRPKAAHSRDQKFFDYYYPLTSLDGHEILLVLTIDVLRVREAVISYLSDFGFLFTALIIALAAVCLLTIYYVILRPLKAVQQNIRLYKDTKDSEAVARNLSSLKSHNELSLLSDDVTDLTKEIKSYTSEIERISSERERIETELTLASRIQTAMLPGAFPPSPERKDFEIFASMTPAREVGGDFYDFFLVDDDHLCLLIADVSGKGIPAALFMMASKISLSHAIKLGLSPAQVLDNVNASICENNPEEMFITVWLGILELSSGKLTAANAGHEYPMLMEPEGRFELIRDVHGFVLGGVPEARYREYELQLEPGSKLFLYTDGLAEAVDTQGRMFGTERILAELNKSRDAAPEKLLGDMRAAVSAYEEGREPFDDLTMLCITYHGPGDPAPKS
ncbi:MAG: SpoIIE family protein phosphatase [Oscillospiraceae bacterium]|nr:SpoIIE family protein phosphatase [Oscillospiraceae bacterium]